MAFEVSHSKFFCAFASSTPFSYSVSIHGVTEGLAYWRGQSLNAHPGGGVEAG